MPAVKEEQAMPEKTEELKEIGGYLTFPIFVLVSTWGLLKTIVDVLERLNNMRNFSLGMSKEAQAVPKDLRLFIFRSDWVPLYIGLTVAVVIFACVYLLIPRMFREMSADSRVRHAAWARALNGRAFCGLSHLQVACYSLGGLAAFVAIAHLIAGWCDWSEVVARIGNAG
jgi:hypothetical protein